MLPCGVYPADGGVTLECPLWDITPEVRWVTESELGSGTPVTLNARIVESSATDDDPTNNAATTVRSLPAEQPPAPE